MRMKLNYLFVSSVLLVAFSNPCFAEPKISCIGQVEKPSECPAKNISYGQLFFLRLSEWDDHFNDPSKIMLYINDIPLPYYVCEGVNKYSKKLFFQIEVRENITDNTQRTLVELIRRDFSNYNNVMPLQISIGLRDGSFIVSQNSTIQFVFFNAVLAVVVAILAGIIFFIGFYLLYKYKALNESRASDEKSLRKFQVVYWTFIIAFCYFSLWLILQDAPILPPSVIGLLSISIGTTVISSFIPSAKGTVAQSDANTFVYTSASKGLSGLLVDNNDEFSVTRLQFWIFTILFGLIFIYTAIWELHIYDFSLQQLTLMGVSSAGYLGMKAAKAPKVL